MAGSSNPKTRSRVYLPQIDGLRFLAAGLVFLFHCPRAEFLPIRYIQISGWTGVNLFFVISSFLLTYLLLLELDDFGAVNIKYFFLRRVLRIWPLFWGYLLAMVLLELCFYPGNLVIVIKYWLSHIFFFNNILVSISGFSPHPWYCVHLWTISAEEQFYCLVPFLVPFLFKLNSQKLTSLILFAIIVTLFLLRVLLNSFSTEEWPNNFIWTSPLRFDGMFMGMGLAFAYFRRKPTRMPYAKLALGVLLLALTLYFCPKYNTKGLHQTFIYFLVDLSFVIIMASTLVDSGLARILSLPWLTYLGKISYGLYIYHAIIVLSLSKIHFFSSRPLVFIVVSFACTLAVAVLSYELFERKILNYKDRFAIIPSRPT